MKKYKAMSQGLYIGILFFAMLSWSFSAYVVFEYPSTWIEKACFVGLTLCVAALSVIYYRYIKNRRRAKK